MHPGFHFSTGGKAEVELPEPPWHGRKYFCPNVQVMRTCSMLSAWTGSKSHITGSSSSIHYGMIPPYHFHLPRAPLIQPECSHVHSLSHRNKETSSSSTPPMCATVRLYKCNKKSAVFTMQTQGCVTVHRNNSKQLRLSLTYHA